MKKIAISKKEYNSIVDMKAILTILIDDESVIGENVNKRNLKNINNLILKYNNLSTIK